MSDAAARANAPVNATAPASRYYPVFLDLLGRRCVVLGDGELADEKAATLRAAGAIVEHHRRPCRTGDLRGAFLAIEASGVRSAQQAARREADRRHVLLNVVDVAASSDWIAPAVVRRGPLQVAVSTAGESPFLAATLRRRLERLFGDEWGAFTQVVGTMRRRLRRRGVAAERQRTAYQRLLHAPVRDLLRAGRYAEAGELVAAVERSACADERPGEMGQVVLVGAGPGDAGLLTVAGREALQDADVVFHDALVDESVLALCPPSARIVNVGKRAGCESTSQERINTLLISAARKGQFVVRLKGGDPMLFARGGEELDALVRDDVPVRVIPGVSAALAAPAAAGISVTQRGVAASVAIVTGQRADGGIDHLERLAAAVDTLVVLMPHDLGDVTRRLTAALGADRPAALVSSATLASERTLRAPVSDIARRAREERLGPPWTLVVGEVTRSGARAQRPAAAHPEAALLQGMASTLRRQETERTR